MALLVRQLRFGVHWVQRLTRALVNSRGKDFGWGEEGASRASCVNHVWMLKDLRGSFMSIERLFIRTAYVRNMRKNSKVFVSSLVLVVLCLLGSVTAFGQYENGSVVGTIRDSSGAPIPNAAVTVTNNATAITTATKTNGVGDYDVPSLRVGVYTITASASGICEGAGG